MEKYLIYIEKKLTARIGSFLRLLDSGGDGTAGEEPSYTDSLLSMEVKSYFARGDIEEPRLEEDAQKKSVFYRICSVFDLDDFEKMCLSLAVLADLNPYYEKFFIYMNNDWNSGYPSFGTAVGLYTLKLDTNPEFYGYFEEDGKLAAYFLSICRPEGRSRVRWCFCCRDAFFSLILSGRSPVGEAHGIACWYSPESEEGEAVPPFFSKLDRILDGTWKETPVKAEPAKKAVRQIFISLREQREAVSLMEGYACHRKRAFCLIDIKRLASLGSGEEGRERAKKLCRDIAVCAAIREAWLCVHFADRGILEREEERQLALWLSDFWEKQGTVCFFAGENGVAKSLYPEMWEAEPEKTENIADAGTWGVLARDLPLEKDVSFEFFANTYAFSVARVRQVFRGAEEKRIMRAGESISQRDIKESCIKQAEYRGSSLVTVTWDGYGFDDLVLPERQTEQLRAACGRVKHKNTVYGKWGFGAKLPYGRGVSMVFSGPPGTGKTMCAGIVADTLGTALYRVNLAAVVSKYIGETEKNLHAVFECAREGCGVLFFDEADVLFGRRTQVKDSNDKYSNMEAAYLLQKMEEYEGAVILATNLMQNMDEAFRRRIQFLIEFPMPDRESRRSLWEKAFPVQARLEEQPDYDFLAENFELSGSNIKNIALQAAFYAAEEGKGVKMEHIIRALLAEMRKSGRRITCGALREYGVYYGGQ